MSAGLGAWWNHRTAGAPPALVQCAAGYLEPGSSADPAALGAAGWRALEATLRLGPDRRAALDLLAADALVTAALQAEAEFTPGRLVASARALRRMASGVA